MTAAPPTRCQPDTTAANRDDLLMRLRSDGILRQQRGGMWIFDREAVRLAADELERLWRCDAESVEAAARIIHPGAFDQEAGSEHQRHEAKTKAERVLALVPPPSEAESGDARKLMAVIEASLARYADIEKHGGLTELGRHAYRSVQSLKKEMEFALSPDQGTVAVTSAVNARVAVIEECAKVAEAQAQTFLSPQYASNQPLGSLCERFACEEVAKAIRALAIPSARGNTP